MRLLAIELRDFRNIGGALLEPHPRFNVLWGPNGQGKTNFLEAVFLLGTLRSFRATRLEELVRFAAPGATVRARVARRDLERLYEVEVVPGPPARKLSRVDGKGVRPADYFGGFNVVLFCPDDLRLPRGAPSARRRFLDRAVWNAEPAFLDEAQTYERVLRSRNALLRTGRPAPDLLAVWDEQLADVGARLVHRRRRYLGRLAPRYREAFARFTQSGLPADLRYHSEVPEGELAAGAAAILEALERARPRDLAQGYTTHGPHTDDLELLLDGRPARLYASQGQLRALVLALKVAEIGLLEQTLDEPPVLLLDDVSSELDARRNELLFAYLGEVRCQVFITTTDPAHVKLGAERLDHPVSGGRIGPITGPAAFDFQ